LRSLLSNLLSTMRNEQRQILAYNSLELGVLQPPLLSRAKPLFSVKHKIRNF